MAVFLFKLLLVLLLLLLLLLCVQIAGGSVLALG